MAEKYGKELILDLHGCDVTKFNRKSLTTYFEELCELIDMQREDLHFWDDEGLPPERCQTDPKTKGISAVQFILTSNVTIHALELLAAMYINIFSCREFDAQAAATFTTRFFGAKTWTMKVVDRI